ncbi:MAG: RluA family pseudouridine synthase, partial [Mogibacterium sp.]|nr:RluA family pseudouridine synthase [Mogibacterium sp.]
MIVPKSAPNLNNEPDDTIIRNADTDLDEEISAEEQASESGIVALTVSEEDAGARLDAFIGWNTDELSRSYAVRLIEKGRVTVNGKAPKSKKQIVSCGDEIAIDLPEPETLDVKPEDIPLEIVYEDDDVLVVNKPRGMVVHPGPGNWSGTLVNAVMHHCGDSLS